MTNEPDLDALVAGGALDSDEDRRERRVAMRRLVDAAFRSDVSYSIDMAKAGWEAVATEARRAEAAKARATVRQARKGR
ncbi:hypothetical protein [Microbacterium sp. AG238]|uniref:hypothetical protein n=1 Tax=Microbacterium sp. AG238 TaxID=2183994 RepID=UPI000E764254|nr:hypothetical protein [Microbacterium sp. AG238]RKE60521.1 hypothetical protein DEU36_2964 [Microbacterium sp. AG238]